MLPWHIWQADVAKRALGAGTDWGVESTLLLLQNINEQAIL